MCGMAEPASITIRRRVQWHDTDASTKYHNTAPLRFMEEAEGALLHGLGLVREVYGWLPRRQVTIEYLRPLRFWDEIEVSVRVEEVGRTSVTYGFDITRDGERAAEGRVVAVLIDGDGAPRAWPEDDRRLLLEGGSLSPEG
jgi:YbgC/YbaW family acyl-CoA thioester hydrolase